MGGSCGQDSIDGGTNKQLYLMKMGQTSRRHPRQNLNRNFIEEILLCSEDLQLDLSYIRQNQPHLWYDYVFGSAETIIIGLYFA